MIDVIAAVWLGLSVVGVLYSFWAVNDALGDRQWLRDSGLNGSRRLIAHANVRNEYARLVVMLLLILTGFATFHTVDLTAEHALVYLPLVAGLAVLVVWAVMDRRARLRLIDYEVETE